MSAPDYRPRVKRCEHRKGLRDLPEIEIAVRIADRLDQRVIGPAESENGAGLADMLRAQEKCGATAVPRKAPQMPSNCQPLPLKVPVGALVLATGSPVR